MSPHIWQIGTKNRSHWRVPGSIDQIFRSYNLLRGKQQFTILHPIWCLYEIHFRLQNIKASFTTIIRLVYLKAVNVKILESVVLRQLNRLARAPTWLNTSQWSCWYMHKHNLRALHSLLHLFSAISGLNASLCNFCLTTKSPIKHCSSVPVLFSLWTVNRCEANLCSVSECPPWN